MRKVLYNNPKLDIVNMNAYIQFGVILSMCSQDIEQKRNLVKIKAHDSGINVQKMTCNNPKIDLHI